jgi:hypothetical protein
MPNPTITEDATGNKYILDGRSYRQLTKDEEALLNDGSVRAFGRMAPTYGKELIQQNRDQMAKTIAVNNARQRRNKLINPTATASGANALEGGLLALDFAGGFTGAGRRAAVDASEALGSKVASRYRARSAPKKNGDSPDLRPDELSPDQMAKGGVVVDEMGVNGTNASSRRAFYEQMKNMPGFRTAFEGMEDFIGKQRNLTNDQARLLAESPMAANFNWLPGQRNGNNVMAEMIKSQPFMADALDAPIQANAETLTSMVMRAVGLEGQPFGRDVLTDARRSVGRMIQAPLDTMTPQRLPDDLLEDALGVMTRGNREAIEKMAAKNGGRLSGTVIGDIRSKMNSAIFKANRSNDFALGEQLEESIGVLDDIIEAGISDPVQLALMKEGRQRWRTVLALDGPGVIQPDGSISLKSLAIQLDKKYQKEFRGQLFAPRDGSVTPDTADLMDFARLSRSFESNLGDSVTATRQALGQILSSPMETANKYAYQRTFARFITDVILDDPVPNEVSLARSAATSAAVAGGGAATGGAIID